MRSVLRIMAILFFLYLAVDLSSILITSQNANTTFSSPEVSSLSNITIKREENKDRNFVFKILIVISIAAVILLSFWPGNQKSQKSHEEFMAEAAERLVGADEQTDVSSDNLSG